MSENLNVAENVEAIVPVEEIVYAYQPVDENGRNLGGKQVFKGTSEREVLDKVAKAHQEIIKLNRELNKKLRLGDFEEDTIPETAVRYIEEEVEFAPKEFTAEERSQIVRDILDPEKFEEASQKLVEHALGTSPEKLRKVLSKVDKGYSKIEAEKEAEMFVKDTPEYYVCRENFETMVNWMWRYKLAPLKINFKLAYDTLKAAGLLLEAPIVREEPVAVVEAAEPVAVPTVENVVTPVNSQPELEDASRITSDQPSQLKRNTRVASGLTNNTTSNVGVTIQSKKLSIAEIEKMSSEEYKKRLITDPNFSKEVEEAYAASNRQ
jgi:transposase-like protein